MPIWDGHCVFCMSVSELSLQVSEGCQCRCHSTAFLPASLWVQATVIFHSSHFYLSNSIIIHFFVFYFSLFTLYMHCNLFVCLLYLILYFCTLFWIFFNCWYYWKFRVTIKCFLSPHSVFSLFVTASFPFVPSLITKDYYLYEVVIHFYDEWDWHFIKNCIFGVVCRQLHMLVSNVYIHQIKN